MEKTISGIHHVTVIAPNPQRNLDFYTEVLGFAWETDFVDRLCLLIPSNLLKAKECADNPAFKPVRYFSMTRRLRPSSLFIYTLTLESKGTTAKLCYFSLSESSSSET